MLTLSQAAHSLGCHLRTLHKWLHDAAIAPASHQLDKRKKLLTMEQVEHLRRTYAQPSAASDTMNALLRRELEELRREVERLKRGAVVAQPYVARSAARFGAELARDTSTMPRPSRGRALAASPTTKQLYRREDGSFTSYFVEEWLPRHTRSRLDGHQMSKNTLHTQDWMRLQFFTIADLFAEVRRRDRFEVVLCDVPGCECHAGEASSS